MKTKKRIERIRIVHEPDDCPDLSWLGEYANQPGPDDRTIDREENVDRERNEFRYFIATMSGEETGNPQSVEQDYDRMEAYNRGDWAMIGISAIADVVVEGTFQKISSPGLWGIESDSGDKYFDEVADEEKSQLADILAELGFSRRAIAKAMKGAETVMR